MATITEPKSALLMKPEWAHEILHNGKDLELRSSPCHSKVGKTVALGTGGMLLGEVTIVGCFFAGSFMSLIHVMFEKDIWKITNIWAWELKNPIVYSSTPKPYFHPKGAIVWIDLTKQRDGKPLVKREPEQRIRRVVTIRRDLQLPVVNEANI